MRWITAHNLQEWSSSLAARTTFPGLIADLITASAPNISEFRFPNREKGQVRGFDGVLEAIGSNSFVPEGRSLWEFGVTNDVSKKADSDFEKRTKDVDVLVRADTTFIFVTPRTWDLPKKQIPEWLTEKRALGAWKGVECLDGVKLEHWLDMHPAVASHYARYELGLTPSTGAYSSSEFWDEFSTRFTPTLKEEVLLAGRDAQAAELLRQLEEDGSRLAFAADSPDEVIAFVVAAIRRTTPETRAFLEARAMVVDSTEAARQLINKKGLIFLPRGQARQLVGLLEKAGQTVISAGADDQRGQHKVLARPTSSELAKAFVSMGIPESDGYELARRCGRSLAVLARQKPSGTAEPPEWEASESLIPALLAGAWKSSAEADIEVLKMLGRRASYDEIEAPLRGLTKLKDPPIDRTGDLWTLRAPVDAFLHLGHLIGGEHLAQFADQARAVFSQVVEHPKAEDFFPLSLPQRVMHSRWLREGMMTTLLLMSALHEEADFSVVGSTPQKFVDDVVRGLPKLSNDHRLLESLRDHLPLLAEAAPIPFFEALERLLEGDAEKIRPIFSEREDFFAPASAHIGVLWALELLAWNENHLLRAAMCLAKLAAVDPGGKLVNRPINSLRDVLLSWSPHTNASHKQRIGVLCYVVREVPSVAWPLLVKLLPQSHGSVSPTTKPKFAEASPGGQETLTYGIIWATEAAVTELAVQHAGLSPERWQILISTLYQLQPASFEHVIKALEDCLDKQGTEDRFETWDALRKEINKHRAFREADWAIKDELLNRLDSLIAKFQPDDPILVTTWLFDDWEPNLDGSRDSNDPMAAILAARVEALKGVMIAQGVQGLANLAARVKVPLQMAKALAHLALGEEDTSLLVRQLLALDGTAKSLSTVVVAQGFASFGPSWKMQVHRIQEELHLAAYETAQLLLGLNDTKLTWDMVASFGTDVDNEYWAQKGAFGFHGTLEEMEFAIHRYQACGRTLAAIQATHHRLQDIDSVTMLGLLKAAVPEINAMSKSEGPMLEYYLEHLFEELEKRSDIAREDLAYMEFVYLPLFHGRKQTLTLHRMMVESPEFFISIISTVFKPASSEAPILSEQERKVVTTAYELLNNLDILPGQVDDRVDFAMLYAWSNEVRQRAAQADRGAITDARIGHLLAHAPVDPEDKAWPHKSVRQLVEQLSSNEIERAVCIERFDMRGVYIKATGEGGQQERVLAEQARDWARAMPEFPRTANMLSSIANMWFKEGEAADASAATEALRW